MGMGLVLEANLDSARMEARKVIQAYFMSDYSHVVCKIKGVQMMPSFPAKRALCYSS
jgi:hypothetical protein